VLFILRKTLNASPFVPALFAIASPLVAMVISALGPVDYK
jgi:hypothetical protein